MKGYSDREVFTVQEKRLLARSVAAVEKFPDIAKDGALVRCHEVARAVQAILRYQDPDLDLAVVDGKYGIHDHSWIQVVTRPGLPHSVSILDAYSVGRLPLVQLILSMAVHRRLFVAQTLREDIRWDVVQDLALTAAVEKLIR